MKFFIDTASIDQIKEAKDEMNLETTYGDKLAEKANKIKN